MQIINKLKKQLYQAPGKRTKRKIVVFESDDWGSIRMPSKAVVEELKNKGFAVEKCRYMQNDSLESNDDLKLLFDVLSFRQKKPVITANFLTANPDFESIEADGFENYHYENLETTLSKYPKHDQVKSLWIKGIEEGLFQPQLHGREHLNVSRWMTDLQKNNKVTKF